jgi:hypothetical protein
MNTLIADRQTPSTLTPEQEAARAKHRDIRLAWRTWLREGHQPTAGQLAAYTLLRGADLDKAFSPIRNARKLANGQHAWDGRNAATNLALRFHHRDWAPFAGLLAAAQSKDVRWPAGEKAYLPESHPWLAQAQATGQAIFR